MCYQVCAFFFLRFGAREKYNNYLTLCMNFYFLILVFYANFQFKSKTVKMRQMKSLSETEI